MTATHKNRLVTAISAVASSGLGALTISTASSGYRTFGAGDDGLTFDGITITEGTAWERRDGCVYTHSGTSLARGTLMDSSTGSAIAFTAAAIVTQGASAEFANKMEMLAGALGRDEISVTGATTATIGRMHHCTGTSANYTVTLPAASGNTGKLIGFRMGTAAALTKLVTIDGNASETIDGATTRIMWATETAIFLCDGSNWFKIAGKTVPMQCQLAKTSYQAIGTATMTDVTLERADVDNVGLMADLANDRILIVRPGKYLIMSHLMWSDSAAAVQRLIGQIYNSNTTTAITAAETTAYTSGVWAVCQAYCLADLLTTSTIKLQAYTTDASPDVYGVGSGDTTQILIIEQPSW